MVSKYFVCLGILCHLCIRNFFLACIFASFLDTVLSPRHSRLRRLTSHSSPLTTTIDQMKMLHGIDEMSVR
jgi:hypothetical protein